MSSIILIAVTLIFIIIISKPASFRNSNPEKFTQKTLEIIAKGNNEVIASFAEEILESISDIFESAKEYDVTNSPFNKRSIGALNILDILSDKYFCSILVCQAPSTTLKIIRECKKSKDHRIGYFLLQEIINQSFSNENSLLLREHSLSGLGLFEFFSKEVFEDISFINSDYTPFLGWEISEDNISEWKIQKYMDCVKKSLYLQIENESLSITKGMKNAFYKIEKIISLTTSKLSNKPNKTLRDSKHYLHLTKVTLELSKIFSHTKIILHDNPKPIKETYTIKNRSIVDITSQTAYKYLDCISRIDNNDDDIRLLLSQIWTSIFSCNNVDKKFKFHIAFEKKMQYMIKKQIISNLNLNSYRYPSMIKIMLQVYRLNISEISNNNADKLHKFTILKIKLHFKSLATININYALDMLPNDIKLDNNTLSHTDKYNNKECIELFNTAQT